MSVYTIAATADLGTISQTITDIKPGDEIVTHGYYTANDGGGARFKVEQGLADESSHFEYTLVNTADKQLKAVMIIKDGTVNIDQLGAKGDGTFPITFEEYLESLKTSEDEVRVTTITDVHDYGTSLVTANSGKTDNNISTLRDNNIITRIGIIDDALRHEEVKEVRLTPGKCYCISAKINIPSGKVLNGCGAMLMPLETLANGTAESTLVYMSSVSDIEVKDIRLFHCLTTGINSTYNKCFYIANCNNIYVHDVTMENANYGMDITSTNVNIRLENLHIEKVITGIEYSDVTGGYLLNSYISCDWNLYNGGGGNHCVYAGGAMKNYILKNLTLVNAGEGSAINRNTADNVLEYDKVSTNKYPFVPSYEKSEDIVIENIIIDNCDTAIHLGKLAERITVKNVIATNLDESGLTLTGIKDVLIQNCYFKGRDGSEDACAITIPSNSVILKLYYENGNVKESITYYDTYNYHVNNVVIKNCSFDFHHKFFMIGNDRNVTGDNMTVKSCYFHIDSPKLLQGSTPAFVEGVVSNVTFIKSVFETDGFSSDDDSKNGVFFYFSSERNDPTHWTFDRCKFINNGSVTVNSPVLSLSNYDSKNIVHCTVKNCTLVNFRWTIRIASTGNTDSSITNPYFYSPEDDNYVPVNNKVIKEAVKAMNSKQRFCAVNNIHQYDKIIDGFNTTHYVKGVDFGI